MPIWLRKFTFQQIQEFYREENEKENQQVKKANSMATKPKIPNYNVKGLKK
jgi:hypothetical protein|tara:strand:+ start:920 stop:1072 length:153 start_codon:yes stop_codon:yes gene_type:complete